MKNKDRVLFIALFILGLISWYVAGIREIYMHIVVIERLSGVVLFVSATSILTGLLAENLQWEKLNIVLLIQLPAMCILLLFEQMRGFGTYSLLTGWGATAWPITFFIQYRALPLLDDMGSKQTSYVYHLGSLLVLFFFCNREIGIGVAELNQTAPVVAQFAQPVFAFFVILSLMGLRKKDIWPVSLFPKVYVWGGTAGVIMVFLSGYMM
jgi:hypothetical protein